MVREISYLKGSIFLEDLCLQLADAAETAGHLLVQCFRDKTAIMYRIMEFG